MRNWQDKERADLNGIHTLFATVNAMSTRQNLEGFVDVERLMLNAAPGTAPDSRYKVSSKKGTGTETCNIPVDSGRKLIEISKIRQSRSSRRNSRPLSPNSRPHTHLYYTMRRIARIQQPSVALTKCLSSQSTHNVGCRAAAVAATNFTASRPRAAAAAAFSTTPTRSMQPSRSLREEKREKTVDIPTPEASIESESEVALQPAQQEELYVSEAAVDAPQMIETDLVLPPTERTKAPRPEELDEKVYVAAESAAGLPVVGGLKGWFAEDDHWGPSKSFAGFASETKVTDPAQLEVCVRRAVLEALAVRSAGVEGLLMESWRADGGWDRALGLGVKVAADGKATLEGDAVGVVEGLAGDEGPREEMMPADQAREIAQMTSREWKQVSLKDARLKFAVSHALLHGFKIQRGSGHKDGRDGD